MAASEAREAYSAERASALAGVPLTTVYYWANNGIWSPSVSSSRTRLWSFEDVLTLRAIYWLRSKGKHSTTLDRFPIPRTKMREVRRTLAEILRDSIDLRGAAVNVDQQGQVLLRRRDSLARPGGQTVAEAVVIDILREFRVDATSVGPDLVEPRPTLRILPGKLSGEPHIAGTRVRSTDVDALLERGYGEPEVREFYPFLVTTQIEEAHDLERQLRRNLRAKAA